jgi:hypothetical protein
MIWKMTCYDMFIIYFNRGNNWFVPKCLVILARIKYNYMYITCSYRTRKLLFWYTNPIMHIFSNTFNIIREKLVVDNFLCKYFIKQLNPQFLLTQFSGNSRSELTDIDGKAWNNIPEAVNKPALSARLDHSCETGWNKHDSSYYSKVKIVLQIKISAWSSTSWSIW